MEDTIAMFLTHARVNVEAAVAEFGDLARQQFNSLRRITENDRLIDLQLQ